MRSHSREGLVGDVDTPRAEPKMSRSGYHNKSSGHSRIPVKGHKIAPISKNLGGIGSAVEEEGKSKRWEKEL